MNTREQLNQYLRGLESRLRWMAVSKGAAMAAGVALGVTLAMVLITNALAFSSTSLTVARVILFLALAVALGFALVLPLMRLNQRRAAKRAETTFPEFEERLLTFVERSDRPDPMLDLLAADTATRRPAHRARARRATQIDFRVRHFRGSRGSGVAVADPRRSRIPRIRSEDACGPAFRRALPAGFYDISIDAGNKLVRRKSDQMVTATLIGFQAPQVTLYARYKSTSKWEAGADAAARQRHRLRVSVRHAGRTRRVLRGSGRREIEDLQAGRRRSAGHQAPEGHLSFPVCAGASECDGRSGRRSARRKSERSRN